MVTNFLPLFSVYADENLTHRINANDVLELINSDNELNLYITIDDLVSSESIYKQAVVLQGEHRVILFDIVKEIQGKYFRNYDLVENIEVQAHFYTKPILKAIFKKLEGLYFYQRLAWLRYFSFQKLEYSYITSNDSGFVYLKLVPHTIAETFDLDTRIFNSKTLQRKMLTHPLSLQENTEVEITSKPIQKPEGTFYEVVLSDKINFAKEYLTDELFNYYLKNEVLYGDGLFGIPGYAVLKDNRPTIYEVQDLMAQDVFQKNAPYYLSQVKHYIAKRWAMWCRIVVFAYERPDVFLTEFFNLSTSFSMDFNIVTRIVGLGVYDVRSRYNLLKPSLDASGAVSQLGAVQYWIYNDDYGDQLSLSTIMTTVTHGDGKINFGDRKKRVYENGQGTEHFFFLPLNSFMEEMDIDLDFVLESGGIGVKEKSYWLVKHAIGSSSVNVKDFTEFYDREHSSPFDNIEFYCPIPIALLNYDTSEMFMAGGGEKWGLVQYTVYKRKYKEDEYGNVTIEDLPPESYPPGTFKIPINKDEYIYKVYVPNALTTIISRDIYFHIKIKFKKTPNQNQNIFFRLFTSDLTFATIYRFKKG